MNWPLSFGHKKTLLFRRKQENYCFRKLSVLRHFVMKADWAGVRNVLWTLRKTQDIGFH